MKVGDSVRLSAYGNNRGIRWAETLQDCVGIVTEAHEFPPIAKVFYKVRWCAEQDPQWWLGSYHAYSRRELKFAKRRK